jgi:hypothetical protein
MTSLAAWVVLVADRRLSHASKNLITSAHLQTGELMAPWHGICFYSRTMVRAKNSMNCLSLYTLLDEELVGGTALAEGLALDQPVQGSKPAEEEVQVC